MTTLEKIDVLRKERKMSRRQLAAKAEIPYSTLASIFARSKDGSADLSMQMMLSIASALDVDVTFLMGDDIINSLKNVNIHYSSTIHVPISEEIHPKKEQYDQLYDATENYLQVLQDVGFAPKNIIDGLSAQEVVQLGKLVVLFCERLFGKSTELEITDTYHNDVFKDFSSKLIR